MHEISDLMQGLFQVYSLFQVINYVVYISMQYFFCHIVIVSDINYHNMVKKILYTYVYHIVYCLGNFEALHEITDFVHQMLRVCASLRSVYN